MSHKPFLLVFVLILIIGLAAIPAHQPVRAAGSWYVSTTGDDNNNCLSPAAPCATINGALAKPGFVPGDTVNVAVGTYTGTGDEVVLIDKDATLSGGWDADFITQNGLSTVDGQISRRGSTVYSGSTAIIERFVFQNGSATQGGGIRNDGFLSLIRSSIRNNTAEVRGGILNIGTLILRESDISGNVATSDEGGITNFGTLTLSYSTIRGNNGTRQGGGLLNVGAATLNNSTVSGNQAELAGGIYSFTGELTLNNSTISGNTANRGGGIVDDSGTVTLQNTLISGNIASTGVDCWSPIGAPGLIISSGYNLIGNTSDCDFTPSAGDLINIDPLLGLMQDNGGPTFTHALLPGSPAIDAGNPAGCTDQDGNALTTDQRGVTRPQGTRCDIGAFELESSSSNEVTIDIKPGRFPNRIKLTNNVCNNDDNVYVAIITTPDFNALTVNISTLKLGDPKLSGTASPLKSRRTDVDGDGDKDLMLTFPLCNLVTSGSLNASTTEMVLTGTTLDGIPITGKDSVKIVR